MHGAQPRGRPPVVAVPAAAAAAARAAAPVPTSDEDQRLRAPSHVLCGIEEVRVMKWTIVMLLGAITGTVAVAGAGGLEQLPPWSPDASVARSEVPEVYHWDLTALYPSTPAWEEAYRAAQADVERLSGMIAGVGGPAELAATLDLYFDLDERTNRLALYANLVRDTAQTDADAIARHQRALSLVSELMAASPGLRSTILGMDSERLAAAFRTAPELEAYRPFVETLRRRAHAVLGPEAERVLSLAGDNLWAQMDLNELPSHSENAFGALISEMPLPTIRDAEGREVQLSFANYGRYRASADRRVRRDAVHGMLGALRGFENTFAATLGGQAAFDVFLARARGYDTALEAYLEKDDLDPAVYRNLVATVRDHAGALHRYVALRQQVMGLDAVHLYDLYVPMVEGVDREIPYPEGARLIVDALEPMGAGYLEVLRTAIDPHAGWIDVYPHRDKASGAFSASVYGVHPYVKMNYQDRYDDVSTLAHELGHALHSHLAMATQPYVTWRYVPFLAEIASTANEVLLSEYMAEHAATAAERAWILSELAETIRTTIYRQALFAEFELRVHELVERGEPVTAERLNGIYGELLRAYYGPDYSIDEDDPVEWAYIPHFYYKYYVYSYATGLASGIAIAERVRTEGEPAQRAFLEMLAGGSSGSPLEMLRRAGVDLREPAAIASALELFDRTVAELEELLAPPE